MKSLSLLLVFLMYRGTISYAQVPPPTVLRFTTDNGLPQNSVKAIAFDKWGFCWLTTEMGLVRYDGRSFTTFGASEITGLRSERMSEINLDRNGDLFVLASDKQVMQIQAVSPISTPAPKRIDEHHLHVSRQGFIVNDEPTLRKISQFYREDPAHTDDFHTASLVKGEVYFFGLKRLLYQPSNQSRPVTLRTYSEGDGHRHTFLGTRLYLTLYPGNTLEAWQQGRIQTDITKIYGSLEKDQEFITGKFNVIANSSGTFIYTNKNLHQLFLKGRKIISVKVLEQVDVPAFSSVFYVKEYNRYFFGSLTDGLFVVQPSHFKHPETPETVGSASSYTQVKLNDSTIFCQDLLISLRRPSTSLAIGSERGGGACMSQQGQLYFQKKDSISRYDFNTGATKNLISIKSRLLYIRPDKATLNSYTFVTQTEIGTLISDSISKYRVLPKGTSIVYVTHLKGAHYLLCTTNGLKWYNAESGTIYKSVLDSIRIQTALSESEDRIWISTYGKGFYLFEKGKIYKMPLGPFQALKIVHSFIDDGRGYFWLPTNNGLFKVSKAELLSYASDRSGHVYFFRFSTNDGLRSNEFNGGSDQLYVWLKDSLLSISSLKGLVWLYPNRISPPSPNKSIYVDSIKVDDKSVKPKTNRIELPPGFTTISLRISSPYFGNMENMNLRYMLKGLENRWYVVGTHGLLRIHNLPSGHYELLFQRNGVFNQKEELKIDLLISPYFYNTWWFYLTSVSVLILIFHLLFRLRLRSLRRKSRELEKIVSSRTNELQFAVEELAKSELALLESNRFKDQMITIVLHDMRSPLRFISLISGRLLKNKSNASNQELSDSLSDLYVGTQNLLAFTEQFFFWITSQQQGFKVRITDFPLQTLFDEVGDMYKDIIKTNRNQLSIEQSSLECRSDYQILSIVIRNLIDNANKNTFKGIILVSSSPEGSGLVILIRDTGAGMSNEQIATFMNRDKGISYGAGSLIVHEMLNYINGTINISSDVGKGSTFVIHLKN